jgi:hypothetical protein
MLNIPNLNVELIYKKEQLDTNKRKLLFENFFEKNIILLITPFILKLLYNNYVSI